MRHMFASQLEGTLCHIYNQCSENVTLLIPVLYNFYCISWQLEFLKNYVAIYTISILIYYQEVNWMH